MPIFRLTDHILFPPPHLAEEGLLAIGGDLSPERLLAAYRSGVFPWFNRDDPILWWSPDPRMLLYPERVHIARSLKRAIRRQRFQVTADTDFRQVIENCATTPRIGQQDTWIVPDMIEAYIRLHARGYAHAIECRLDNRLVGGLYGISIGACFFGESMYSHETNASKIAMIALARQCQRWQFHFVDCQMPTAHLTRMGAQPIPRDAFLKQLKEATRHTTRKGPWHLDDDILADL